MYDNQQIDETVLENTAIGTAADPITTARRSIGSQPKVIRALWATVNVAIATSTITLTFKYRPTPGSASGEVVLGTVLIPITATAGKILYKNVTPYQAAPGGEVVIQTNGNGAGAGTVSAGYRATPNWENLANNANAIASA